MTRPEENLQYWKMLAEEHGCYQQPYRFTNDSARLTFFRRREPDLYYVPHEDFTCEVTMLSGLPGSGKDTWLAQTQADIPVVSLDEIRKDLDVAPTDNQGDVVQRAREHCREFLRNGESFAFNATNLLRQTRGRWIDLFTDYSARIELVHRLTVCFVRIEAETTQFPNKSSEDWQRNPSHRHGRKGIDFSWKTVWAGRCDRESAKPLERLICDAEGSAELCLSEFITIPT